VDLKFLNHVPDMPLDGMGCDAERLSTSSSRRVNSAISLARSVCSFEAFCLRSIALARILASAVASSG